MNSKKNQAHQSLRQACPDTNPDSSLEKDLGQLLQLFDQGKLSLSSPSTRKDKYGYHVKTDGRAYFRPSVPKDLAPHLGSYPSVNLGLKAGRAAERLSLMHYIAFTGMLDEVRQEIAGGIFRGRPLMLSMWTAEDIKALAVRWAQDQNRRQYEMLRRFEGRDELEAHHEVFDGAAGDVLSGYSAVTLGLIVEAKLSRDSIPYVKDDGHFRALVFAFAEALSLEFIDPSTKRLYERKAVPPPPLPEPIKAPAKLATVLTIGAIIKAYIQVKQKAPTGYTRKVVRCLELFREMVGAQTPVAELRQRQVTAFLHDICGLPSDWATRFDQGEAVAKMLEEEAEEVMGPRTFNDNYRAPLKAFLRDARRDYGDEGFPALIVDGIEYTGGRKAGEDTQRDLTMPELKRLFEGPEFAAIAQDIGADAAYWLPVISLFTGARPRELCQLNPQCDWGKEGDTFFLLVDEHTPAGKGVTKTVKTGETRRLPLHSELVRLGLPAYLERMKKAGSDRLFPGVRVKKGNPYEVAGQAFTDFLRTIGLYDDTAPPGRQVKGLYVFRKTLITYAGNRGIPTWGLTGHKPEHLTLLQWQSYHSSPAGLELVKADLERIAYPLSIPQRLQGNC